MTNRERWLETIKFGNPDRIPFTPGGGRESTRKRWHSEGLPEDIGPKDIGIYAYRQVGGKMEFPAKGSVFPFNHRMIPEFEGKVIERKENSQVVQDWKGNICEIGLEFTVEHLQSAIDFCTRRWIKCPVESHEDWQDMKRRYNPDDPKRMPENPAELGEVVKNQDNLFTISFPGPYWQLREWCGFEGLSMMFYDNPKLVEEMIEFWQDFISELMEKTFQYVTPDMVHISEDMAYKGYSMLSPEMTRKYLLPCWRHWGELCQKYEVPLYGVDSDGFIGELIPIWIDAGMIFCDPIEVAAGNDINAFRKEFGKNMAYRGGVDKREMAKGGEFIKAEMERIMPVIKDGGFVPSCDHGIPSDVSWPAMLEYVELLAKATRWL